VCSGGVELNSLDNNLQAKNCKGLYFIGETVNVDGLCGGYNLQWAWTSGKIVGEIL
ncbi:MAG: NAD(P)/FAD-dependent oxidoreductase, partial [Eubacteriales bacterium]|nr:NAD(P)/FAD-dependent oxidoreductase [Eubacteriales bacterium]